MPDRSRDELAEVRVVTDDDGSGGITGVDVASVSRVARLERVREAVVDRDRRARWPATISAVRAARTLGEVMKTSGAKLDAGEEHAQPLGLTLALVRQRPGLVGALPGEPVAGMGVAEEGELGHDRRGYPDAPVAATG